MVAEIRFGVKTIDHIAIPVRDLGANQRFYTDILGLGPLVPIACRDEMMIPVQSGQMIGLVEVRELSDRSKKHGRGCHMAIEVPQEDFDSMVGLVERYGGKTQGNRRADDGLRPEGEILTAIACKSPPRRTATKMSRSPTKKNGAASSPAAKNKAAA